jgi:hypothetical protein
MERTLQKNCCCNKKNIELPYYILCQDIQYDFAIEYKNASLSVNNVVTASERGVIKSAADTPIIVAASTHQKGA